MKTVKCAKQEKGNITCRKLILKEEEGERRTSYNLQTGRFFSCFFLFFFALFWVVHFLDFTKFKYSYSGSRSRSPWGSG